MSLESMNEKLNELNKEEKALEAEIATEKAEEAATAKESAAPEVLQVSWHDEMKADYAELAKLMAGRSEPDIPVRDDYWKALNEVRRKWHSPESNRFK